ncbi:MAG TPA: S24/S26 family peptidase [Candidatus Sphingobacterium stercorigallinarum]|nr:S24/S26 family peptidase [Candidatus Sphingobacterium stercorigallinarum]
MNTALSPGKIIPNRIYFQEVTRLLDENKQVRIPVKGGSMRPFLGEGDLVVLTKTTEIVPPLGSIVLARYRDGVVLHRLVRRGTDRWTLAGDGNLVQTEMIGVGDVLAVAIKASRGDRDWSLEGFGLRWSGLLWYALRLPRRVGIKLSKWIGVKP